MLPVIILCGGLGTRIRTVSKNQPKSLIEICGKPFLYWQLDCLIRQGISKVILCAGYRAEEIQKAVKNYYYNGKIEIIVVEDGELLLGTGGALKKASKLVEDNFFVMYGDSFLTCSFAAVQRSFYDFKTDALLTVYRNEGCFDKSNIVYEDGRILRYEKNTKLQMSYIDYGLGVYNGSVFADIPSTIFDLSIVISKLAASSNLNGFQIFERFYEIGSVNGIKDFEKYLLGIK